MSKKTKNTKIARNRVIEIANNLTSIINSCDDCRDDTDTIYPYTLHEARKYNRTIKQNAERLCKKSSPTNNIDDAEPTILKIYKAAEVLSHQFTLLEFISSEDFSSFKVNEKKNLLRIVARCKKMYQENAINKDLILSLVDNSDTGGSDIVACEKTILIIPNVLIDNAIKYSVSGSRIEIKIGNEYQEDKKLVTLTIQNIGGLLSSTKDIFAKGVRGSDGGDGSGYGLYIANLVAKQHNACIKFDHIETNPNHDSYEFRVAFPAYK